MTQPERNGRDQTARAAAEQVYDELRRLAGVCFRGQPDGHTLEPTALVNEAYLRLARRGVASAYSCIRNSAPGFSVATGRILV